MFRHQMTGSWQDGRNCRLPLMSCVSVALLPLACGLAGAVDYDNTFTNYERGIYLHESDNNTVAGNTLSNNTYGTARWYYSKCNLIEYNMANPENLNAVCINEGLEQAERLTRLNRIAIQQMRILMGIELLKT